MFPRSAKNLSCKVKKYSLHPNKTMEKQDQAPEEVVEEVPTESFLKIDATHKLFDAALYGQTVQKGFAKMYNDPLLSDITLVLGSEKIPAHRMVLCAWSETFRSMLSQEWKESKLQELPIVIDPSDVAIFKHMLHYMYTGDVAFVTGANVINLIRLSDYYGILSLKEVCGELLGEQISPDNVLYLLDIVDHFDCTRLNTHCGLFLARNFTDIFNESPERMLSLKVSTWAEMLKSDELQVRSEEKLFEHLLAYVGQFDQQKREEALSTLLPLVRYSYLRGRFLLGKVEANETINKLPVLQRMLHEVYRYKLFPKSKTGFITRSRRGFQRYDREFCAPTIKLNEEEEQCTLQGSGWQNVRCICPFTEKYSYCEFLVDNGPNVMIGIVDGDCIRNSYAGQFANGWTYYSQGSIYHAGGNPTSGATYSSGDRVGVQLDYDTKELLFYKNGVQTCKISGIPITSTELFPIVCLSASGNAVTILPTVIAPEESEK